MNNNSRFMDKGDLTVLDNETGLIWAKEDSWPIAQDWLAFQEALQFVDEMNKNDYLGFHDWRIPEKEEIEKLFIPESTIMARSSCEIHLDPLFASGGGIAYLTGPTAGYLYGMLLASITISYFANLGFSKTYLKASFSLLIGSIIIFTIGILYLGYIIGFEKSRFKI